jgi:hypothetical protein
MIARLAFHLRIGDHAWEGGALSAARAAYIDALRTDRSCWHAAFQVVWIDLAFASIPASRLHELVRAAPDDGWRALLASRCEEVARGLVLAGGLCAWDIEALRRCAPTDHAWWEAHGDRAHAARQYGLARACFDHASNYTTLYEYDPPRRYGSALGAARRLLEALRDC